MAQESRTGTTIAEVVSVAGVRLCEIFEAERDSSLAEIRSLIQERAGIPIPEQKLLLGDEILREVEAQPLQAAPLVAVITLVRQVCRWDRALLADGATLSEDDTVFGVGPEHCSMRALNGFESGHHAWECKINAPVLGSTSNCRIGIVDGDFSTWAKQHHAIGNDPQGNHAAGFYGDACCFGQWQAGGAVKFDNGDVVRFDLDLESDEVGLVTVTNVTKQDGPKLFARVPKGSTYFPAASLYPYGDCGALSVRLSSTA